MIEYYLCDISVIVEALKDSDIFAVASLKNEHGNRTIQGIGLNHKTDVFVVSDRCFKLLQLWNWI